MNQGFQRFLKGWFASKAGEVVFKQEKQLIDQALDKFFGYYLVQLGCISHNSIVDESRVSTKLIIDPHASQNDIEQQDPHLQWIQADFDFLPIGHDKVDVVVLPHTLETIDDPYYALRQVDSMLVPEGHIVISGFNPVACLSLRLKFKYWAKGRGFELAEFRRAAKIREWLEVLGYEVQKVRFSPVMCFSSNEKYKTWGRFIEKVETSLKFVGLEFGNVYCLVARKRVDSPTLVGVKWQLPRWRAANNGVASQRINSSKKIKNKEVDAGC